MKKLPIALQLYSVRDDMAADFEGTLRKVRELGYDGVEFAGLHGRQPAEVRRLLAENGLAAVSAHVPIDELAADIPGVVGAYKEIGCAYIALPWMDEERRPGHAKYPLLLEQARAIAEECRRQGMLLLYHNHDFEFEKVDGEYGLDRLYRDLPADLLATEFDTCWINVAGEDPVAYLHTYAGRAPVVHLKDFVMPAKSPPSSTNSSAWTTAGRTKAAPLNSARWATACRISPPSWRRRLRREPNGPWWSRMRRAWAKRRSNARR